LQVRILLGSPLAMPTKPRRRDLEAERICRRNVCGAQAFELGVMIPAQGSDAARRPAASAKRSPYAYRRAQLMRLFISMAILATSALPALADRQVTEDERAKLVAAVQAEGCSGGKFEMDEDDQQFEVDDAVCADGKKYDLKFDMQMRLKRKNLD
jgi:hypothetical protein